jgi:hypothetical protein
VAEAKEPCEVAFGSNSMFNLCKWRSSTHTCEVKNLVG